MGFIKILNINAVRKFLLVFYIVAVIGFLFPLTYPYFKILTPLALLINVLLLFNFHENWNIKFVIISIIILLTSYFAEVIGVNTGIIFGNYTYGKMLGPKLFNTPLITALSWLMLIYCTYIIINLLNIHTIYKIVVGALILVLFDIVMEPAAINFGMWAWEGNQVPILNSISWFILSLLLLSLLKVFKTNIKNEIGKFIIAYQFAFFVILLLYFYFV
ncbi:carotenoid biosynthesis protein [Bacteroidota bacterium]